MGHDREPFEPDAAVPVIADLVSAALRAYADEIDTEDSNAWPQ
ncbi:MAG: hypothetical protein ACYDCQ_21095 [Dehalococcoidia bacterium]